MLCGETFYEKPPLLYWTQALGYLVFGVGEYGARIGTALAGAVTPLVLYGFARRPLGRRAAFFSAIALATSLEFVALSRIAFTDMLLLAWLLVCVAALHRAFEALEPEAPGRGPSARATGWFALACVASGLAILTKGAIGVLFPGAVALVHLVLWRRLGAALRPAWIALALPLVLGIGFSWYLLLGFTHPDGFGFMRDLFLEHHVGRFSAPMQGHEGSPLYYLPVIAVGFLPWSPFLPLALARTRLRGRDERERFLRLFALLSAIALLFFSIAATKLPNYAAPALPGLALLVGDWFARATVGESGRGTIASYRAALACVALFALVLALAAFAAPHLHEWLSERARERLGLEQPLALGIAPVLAALALAAAFAAGLVAARERRPGRLFAALAIGFACTYTIVFQGVLPRVDARFGEPLRRLAVRAAQEVPAHERIVMLALRRRPSVCFYADRETTNAGRGSGLAEDSALFAGPEGRVGITREALIPRFPASVQVEVLERDSGFALFRARPATAPR
jgi:4-amino-4-deoxy-L-arabinose transferase-like glycosyltransferase